MSTCHLQWNINYYIRAFVANLSELTSINASLLFLHDLAHDKLISKPINH